MRKRVLVGAVLLAFVFGVFADSMWHSVGSKLPWPCSYDVMPFGVGHTPVGVWMEEYCGA